MGHSITKTENGKKREYTSLELMRPCLKNNTNLCQGAIPPAECKRSLRRVEEAAAQPSGGQEAVQE